MKLTLKDNILVVRSEDEGEQRQLGEWCIGHVGHVFDLVEGSERGLSLHGLGAREEACREPINILFEQGDPRWWPISNLAPSPFGLHGRTYASIEGFWQGLKYSGDTDRRRIAQLTGREAKHAGDDGSDDAQFQYEGQIYHAGTYAHWTLMEMACRAKFTQYPSARESLLATGTRPLQHKPRRDSRIIPGALMAEIWMRTRAKLTAPD